MSLKDVYYSNSSVFCYHLLQAGILAVGRGNKVVEPVIGADGMNSWMSLYTT